MKRFFGDTGSGKRIDINKPKFYVRNVIRPVYKLWPHRGIKLFCSRQLLILHHLVDAALEIGNRTVIGIQFLNILVAKATVTNGKGN